MMRLIDQRAKNARKLAIGQLSLWSLERRDREFKWNRLNDTLGDVLRE